MLDRIPTEILDHIVKLACTDGGQTGSALAAVSHRTRDVSTPVRYHSIALRGARQIRAFLKLLEDIERTALPPSKPGEVKRWKKGIYQHTGGTALSDPVVQVRHLFLADCAKDRSAYHATDDSIGMEWESNTPAKIRAFPSLIPDIDRPKMGDWQCSANSKSHPHDQEGLTRMRLRLEALNNADAPITALFTRLAPSLQHLCYDGSAMWSIVLFRVPFPALEELTCRVSHGWTSDFVVDVGSSSRTVQNLGRISILSHMPMLRDLHVVHYGMIGQTEIPEELPPLLTRVRFSDAFDPALLVDKLTEHKKGPWLTHDSLRTILISHKRDGSYLPDAARNQPVSAQLFEYARKNPSRRIHMVEDLLDYDLHRLHVEWLARVQDGEGCWKEGTPLALMK
jgi:hypothetical protein